MVAGAEEAIREALGASRKCTMSRRWHEVISQGWGQRSVHGAGDALPALPQARVRARCGGWACVALHGQVWALALGPEWAPAWVAFFHSRMDPCDLVRSGMLGL